MHNIESIAEEIRAILNDTNAVREEALKLSREVVRLSANSIRASHREDFDEANALKAQARQKVQDTKAMLADRMEMYYTGYVQDAQKEYAESELTYCLIRESPIPRHDELGVEPAAYLNGLAEAIGECRRHVLDVLRHGDLERAERILGIMDEVYYALITFDYPDAVTQGLRRQTDMVRGVLERTRGDITILRQQAKLEASIEQFMERLNNGPGSGHPEGGDQAQPL